MLNELGIPVSSQMLVFSRTSLQRGFISPENPRAIFFNDDVYVGFIPGAPFLELSAADSRLGAVFYHLENQKVQRPAFLRGQDCLNCHGGERSLGVPGHFVRSVGTDSTGEIQSQTETKPIDQCTPLANRWAGWYVTGKHGPQTHRGNLIDSPLSKRGEPTEAVGNVTNLSCFFDTTKHLRGSSDIVALMVLEHQLKMHNYITRLSFATQIMTNMYGHVRYLRKQEDAFLRYLLFTEETKLTAPIEGDADFTRHFASLGPFDRKGRSLRDLDLRTRLFKYPCSYLIYSEQFDAMPSLMREALLERLHSILTGKDTDKQFAGLEGGTRTAILEILRDTKPNLPKYWLEQ